MYTAMRGAGTWPQLKRVPHWRADKLTGHETHSQKGFHNIWCCQARRLRG